MGALSPDGSRRISTSRARGDDIRDEAIRNGMVTMDEDGLRKLTTGATTLEEAVRAVRD